MSDTDSLDTSGRPMTGDGRTPGGQVDANLPGPRLLVDDPVQIRVLGVLMEKEMSTPAYYPMTVNAITAACNQKNNRDPVVEYEEVRVVSAIEGLRKKSLVTAVTGTGIRVQKYRHNAAHVYQLSHPECAVICLLLLRGPQTPGEIRSRSGSLHQFEGLEQLESVLNSLAVRTEQLITRLGRAAGQKEQRYAHLISGPVEARSHQAGADEVQLADPLLTRIAALEERVEELKREQQALLKQLSEFRRQFE